ncbi:MAG: hypothetical protein AB8B63_01170 [Granulosicoccus sp.]
MNKQETLKPTPTKALCLLAMLVNLQAGCAIFSGPEESSVPENRPVMAAEMVRDEIATKESKLALAEPADLVARDFVGALKQLWKVSPQTTTIYMPDDKVADKFALVLSEELLLAGYDVRWADNLAPGPMLQYTRSTQIVEGRARRYQYDLKLGDVEMRRAYITDDRGLISPAGNMFIRGVDASAVVLDESIFRAQPGSASSNNVPVVTASRLPAIANPLPEIFSSRPTATTMRRQLSVNRNIFDTGVSRFNEYLPAQHIVAEEVLIFQNDSLRIGSVNKQLIGRMVDRFQPQTDTFSVIGCSMGPTSLKGGNAALALGRANRVVEALMFSGVDRSSIVDAGCWSGNSKRKGLPSRGVVIALKRQETTVN